jgi:hypothetical protein
MCSLMNVTFFHVKIFNILIINKTGNSLHLIGTVPVSVQFLSTVGTVPITCRYSSYQLSVQFLSTVGRVPINCR